MRVIRFYTYNIFRKYLYLQLLKKESVSFKVLSNNHWSGFKYELRIGK